MLKISFSCLCILIVPVPIATCILGYVSCELNYYPLGFGFWLSYFGAYVAILSATFSWYAKEEVLAKKEQVLKIVKEETPKELRMKYLNVLFVGLFVGLVSGSILSTYFNVEIQALYEQYSDHPNFWPVLVIASWYIFAFIVMRMIPSKQLAFGGPKPSGVLLLFVWVASPLAIIAAIFWLVYIICEILFCYGKEN